MTLGEYLKNYRLQHGMNIRDFADKSGISRSYISYLERGTNGYGKTFVPTFKMIKQIADATGTTVDAIAELCGDTIVTQQKEPKVLTEREELSVLIDSLSDEKVAALLPLLKSLLK